MTVPLDLVGQCFGRLTVKSKLMVKDNQGQTLWDCLCSCGNTVIARGYSLRNGNTRSCGCMRKEAAAKMGSGNITHGLSKSDEFNIWHGIKERCCNEKHPAYERYGGRGITMCDEWKTSFEAFYRDMGKRPSSDHSLDRKDNDKGYSKENCRWATLVEQANNRRDNILYFHDGVHRTLAAWSRELNFDYKKAYTHLQNGSSFEGIIKFCHNFR